MNVLDYLPWIGVFENAHGKVFPVGVYFDFGIIEPYGSIFLPAARQYPSIFHQEKR